MANYKYKTTPMEELAFKSKSDLKLPRYQRPNKKWNEKAKFGLTMSVFFDLPAGYICWKVDEEQSVLIDGRQRREAIREMLDPLKFSNMVMKAIPKKVSDEKGNDIEEIDKRIYHFAREWLKNYDEQGFIRYYSDVEKYPKIEDLREECDNRLITWNGSDSREKLEKELAKSDMESGIGLEKKYMDLLKPIYELIRSVKKGMKTVSAGFNDTYRCHTKAKLKAWGLDNEIGPRDDVEEPEFFEYDYTKAKWVFNSNKFSNDLVNFFKINGWNESFCRDVSNLLNYFNKYSSIFQEGDRARLQQWYGDAKRADDHAHLVQKFFVVRNAIKKTELGVCELTEDCDITEAMKVFQLINSSGVQLSEIEVMASWPDWGSAWVYTDDAPQELTDAIKELYQQTKEMDGINFKEVSKWDIAATLSARLNHQAIWGW